MENEEVKASTITFKVENENVVEELKKIYPNKDKKKKKFVYLDKYEAYQESTDARFELLRNSLERNINGCYVVIGILAVWLLLITFTK